MGGHFHGCIKKILYSKFYLENDLHYTEFLWNTLHHVHLYFNHGPSSEFYDFIYSKASQPIKHHYHD